MTSDLLREAAAKMRERAEAATPGPWVAEFGGVYGAIKREPTGWKGQEISTGVDRADREHIAAFANPAVAVAVADWLDECAAVAAGRPAGSQPPTLALNVARAYLGRDS